MQLTLHDLSTGYGRQTVSEHLSLTLPAGKVISLIGPNGCGKSTLLKTICRILPAPSGEVLLDGRDIHTYDTQELARKISILPQNPDAPGELRVRQLVAFGRAPHQRAFFAATSAQDRAAIDWALAKTELTELQERELRTLSGGQRQRAFLALALAQQTDILLLDEPTSFLDVAHELRLLSLVRQLNEQYGKTIIMVLHDLNEAARFSDELIAMRAGKVLYQGTPQQVFHAEMLRTVFGIDAELRQDPRTQSPYCIPYPLDRSAGKSPH